MSELVIGMGEVGEALAEVLDCNGHDIEVPSTRLTPTILHIAYPYSDSFVDDTLEYEDHYLPDLVVVHSTVPVGTCDPHDWVHSPVRGRHPFLAHSLKIFPKPFGSHQSHLAMRAATSWPYNATVMPSASTTEAGKLWELAQFGLQIRVTQAIYEWCHQHDLDPSLVYDMFADDYNVGYEEIGNPQFIRPILDYVPGEIGGHCILPGTALLTHEIADIVKDGFE